MAELLRSFAQAAKRLRAPKRSADERGMTMALTMTVMFIVFALGAAWLAVAEHAVFSARYDRARQRAVDAANAGLVTASAALARNSSYAGAALTSFSGGGAEYEVTVATDSTDTSGRRRVVTATGYAPAKAAAISRRTMRQLINLNPVGFQYAMMSEQAITTGSASTIVGDIYANGSITLGNSQNYSGSIYTQDNLTTGSNQNITGDIYATGNVSVASSSTEVKGSVYAGGSVTTGGTIDNKAVAGGTISNCANVIGACSPNTPPPPVPVQHLPAFVWNPANYPSFQSYSTGSAFVSAVSKTNASGVFYVNGSVAFANNDALYLTGDMTIVVNGDITLPRVVQNNTANGATVQLSVISSNGGTITPSNNFTIPQTVNTLMYTTGTFNAKNSSTFSGALYAGTLSNGAHLSVTYQPLSDTGFDWSSANPQSAIIQNITTREINSGS